MNFGRTLFSQVMDYIPWKTFGRIIASYNGDAGVKTLDCSRPVLRNVVCAIHMARITARY